MRILALETSTDTASCAFWRDGEVFFAECPPEFPQSSTLMPLARQIMADAESELAQLDAVAFDAGPGAFTSLRVGCALAQGVALALGIPVVAIGSLECLAWQSKSENVLSLLDARMGEIYAGKFAREKEGVRPLCDVRLMKPEEIVFPECGGAAESWQIAGNALTAYPALEARLKDFPRSAARVPEAKTLAELAALTLRRGGGVDPEFALPRYVRDKVAYTTAERALRAA
ncbi:MAG: tRNA (adenosine(37)-N6)-threonylcarbamoyltransferase complex dimerization subunit type 1 TsaB [Zoogloeaceae bacterium]|nr:tRNA (adenosine(37)-N6)-threonylcarbamoyltransferase complex dimerization subunit type 1 TsaB [Zoogloeaceae bacterium]